MSDADASRRILTGFGESDTFLGLTFTDLKVLLPAVFVGLLIGGNTPPMFSSIGWSVAAAIVLGSLIVIYVAPEGQTPQAWLTDRYRFVRQPSVMTLHGDGESPISTCSDLRPETTDRDAPMTASRTPRWSFGKSTQQRTGLERFYVSHDAGSRTDGYLFGAVHVEPANMALATQEDWAHAAGSFARAVNGIEFPFQIYSTVTPVDPTTITSGYRDRLRDGSLAEKSKFRELIQTYEREFPREFAHRGTSIREFYVVVPVSRLDVQRPGVSVGHRSLLDSLSGLPYVGGFFTAFGASRQGYSPEELEVRQVTELARRLDVVSDGIRSLDGCDATRVALPELVGLLQDFWGAGAATNESPSAVRTTPVISTNDPLTAEESP